MRGKFLATSIASRLSTDTPFFLDLIGSIDRGEVKIPQFQRPFVWKAEQAIRLLDSIFRNYPIGSLLLWRTTDRLATERNIGDFQLPATDDLSPTSYVLDGQQRLTVIYSALASGAHEEKFSASYDLIEQNFILTPTTPEIHIFPLRRLYDTTLLLNFRAALQTHDQAELLQQRLDHLVGVLTHYKIPVVELRDLSLEEVCPIFERINSSGTPLSTYDLMVAATWSKQFDLNESVETISLSLHPKGFDDLSGDTVLKVLSAVHSRSVRRESILALRKLDASRMDKLVRDAQHALTKGIDLLCTDFKVHSLDFLPYEAHLVVLAYVFSRTGVLSETQVKRVRQWFWRTGFRERYRGASENFITRDLEIIHRFVVDGQGDVDRLFGVAPDGDDLSAMRFRKNSSGSRAYALALAKAGPRNLTNGAAIDTSVALSAYNKRQFHHIYPEAFLRRSDPTLERNCILNICMLAASENNRISDDDPLDYIPRCAAQLGDAWEPVLSSNLLPRMTVGDDSLAIYDVFLWDRGRVVASFVAELCAGTR